MSKISEDTAKRSITMFESLVKDLVNETNTFVKKNKTNGLTTPALKRKANSLLEKLGDQFKRMKDRWDTCWLNLEMDHYDTFLLLKDKFEESQKTSEKALESLHELVDRVSTSNTPDTQNGESTASQPERQLPKPVSTFKPAHPLPNSANLSEFNSWEKSVLAYMNVNKNFLASSDNATNRYFVTSLLDDKIQAALEVDKDMEDMAIPIKGADDQEKSILKWVRDYILRYQPVYIRRYNYSMVKQGKNESFTDFWNLKLAKAREAEIEDMDAEAFQIVELITSIHKSNTELLSKCLEKEKPTLEELVEIGKRLDHANAVQKQNFGEASARKASNYQNSKRQNWDNTEGGKSKFNSNSGRNQKSYGRNQQRNSLCKDCGSNGGKCSNGCFNKETFCQACGKKGHMKFWEHCPKKSSTARKTETKSKPDASTKASTVRVSVVRSKKAVENHDDCAPTPICNMEFKPKKGKIFQHDVLPDTGCSQSIISHDIAVNNGMRINKRKKKTILNASDEPMICNGTVLFDLSYYDHRTTVEALVSSDLNDEVLLGWQTLKRLHIIHEDFPKPIPMAGVTNLKANVFSAGRSGTEKLPESPDSTMTDSPLLFEMPDATNLTDCKCRKVLSSKDLNLQADPILNVEAAMAAFPIVFQEPSEELGLKTMKGGPMVIQLRPGPIKPLSTLRARKVPYALEPLAKEELKRLETMHIIEFCGTEASEWCSPCSFVRKPNGGVRKVADLKWLNQYVMRPIHPFPTGKEIIDTIPTDTKVFAVFDALKGYWQVELAEESRHLTTFLTEFGRYRYVRAPMGLNASGDEFCLRTDKAIADLPGTRKLVDDILIYAPSHEILLERIIALFKRCQSHGITLSKSKFQYGSEVKFAGFIVNSTGCKPDPSKVASIRDFPAPKDLTNLRSWFGLINQFAAFGPDIKHALAPMQSLLKPKHKFLWLDEHQKAFELVKEILTKEDSPLLRHFDPSLPITLTTDASRTGLGFILTQENAEGNTGLVQCGSRFLSHAETRYAVIELEAMAIQWAILKCKNYLLGTKFVVLTDHKPLEGVMNGRDLDSIMNARLQRIMSKLIGYDFTVKYLPGKINFVADALSRSPVFQPEDEEKPDVLVQVLRINSVAAGRSGMAKDPQLQALVDAAVADKAYQRVVEAVVSKEDVNSLPKDHPGRLYRYKWNFLAYEEDVGLLTVNGRIVVPRDAQKGVLNSLHLQHTGQVKTYANATQLYFWPHMKRDIINMVSNCPDCVAYLPSKPLPPLTQTTASRPFEAMSLDLAHEEGKYYLVAVDRFSGWPLVTKLSKLDTTSITNHLENWNLEYGKPQRLRTDGGPQFRTEFSQWCENNGIIHELSSPEHHQSNGHAENAVKQIKYLLGKTGNNWQKFREALHEWRNTPRVSDGLSPSQWAFGYRQRSEVPALESAYQRISDHDFNEALDKRGDKMAKVKDNFDQNRTQENIYPDGTKVVLQRPPNSQKKTGRWNIFGTIVSKRPHGNSYIVNVDGREFIRSQLHMRPAPDPETSHHKPSSEAEEIIHEDQLRRGKRKRKKTKLYGH